DNPGISISKKSTSTLFASKKTSASSDEAKIFSSSKCLKRLTNETTINRSISSSSTMIHFKEFITIWGLVKYNSFYLQNKVRLFIKLFVYWLFYKNHFIGTFEVILNLNNMNSMKKYLSLMCLTLVLIFSCSKDDKDEPQNLCVENNFGVIKV